MKMLFSAFLQVLIVTIVLLFAPQVVQAQTLTTIFYDDFDNVDGTSLTAHNSAWELFGGTMPVVQDGSLLSVGSDPDFGLPSLILADHCVSLDFKNPADGTIALHTRSNYHDGNQGQYDVYGSDLGTDPSRNDYDLSLYYSIFPQAFHLVNPMSISKSSLSTGWHNFKLCTIGNQITSYIDNVQLLSAIDDRYAQGFFYVHVVAGNYIDNFKIEASVNSAPMAGSIIISPNPVQANTSVTATANFTDIDAADSHTAFIDWGDGSTGQCNVNEVNGVVSCTKTAGYASANVYPVSITVSDGSLSGTSPTEYASVYAPTPQGLFSAGQRFNSPAGAFRENTSLMGMVLFGLSYKYQGDMPAGVRQFTMDFNTANLHLNATEVAYLVTSGDVATLRGTGTIEGRSGTFSFLVSGQDSSNTIRIQIADSAGTVIYDTQYLAPDNAIPTTSITGGNVVVN